MHGVWFVNSIVFVKDLLNRVPLPHFSRLSTVKITGCWCQMSNAVGQSKQPLNRPTQTAIFTGGE